MTNLNMMNIKPGEKYIWSMEGNGKHSAQSQLVFSIGRNGALSWYSFTDTEQYWDNIQGILNRATDSTQRLHYWVLQRMTPFQKIASMWTDWMGRNSIRTSGFDHTLIRNCTWGAYREIPLCRDSEYVIWNRNKLEGLDIMLKDYVLKCSREHVVPCTSSLVNMWKLGVVMISLEWHVAIMI